jgi:hypothetical protein
MAKLDLGTPRTSAPGGTCTVGAYLRDHPDDADDLRAYLADFAWTGAALSDALAAHDVKIPAGAINRHRRRRCACAERGLL